MFTSANVSFSTRMHQRPKKAKASQTHTWRNIKFSCGIIFPTWTNRTVRTDPASWSSILYSTPTNKQHPFCDDSSAPCACLCSRCHCVHAVVCRSILFRVLWTRSGAINFTIISQGEHDRSMVGAGSWMRRNGPLDGL